MKNLFIILLAAVFCAVAISAQAATDPKVKDVQTKTSGVTMPFMANQGQMPEEVKYYAKTFGGTVFVTGDGQIVYSIPKKSDIRHNDNLEQGKEAASRIERSSVQGIAIREEFVKGTISGIKAKDKAGAMVSYFRADAPDRWKSGVDSYETLNLGEVYKGIDVTLRAYGNNVEKLFTVRPESDPGYIEIQLSGVKNIQINEDGELLAATELGSISYTKPIAYQEINGRKIFVQAAYDIRDGNRYGFAVAEYDRTQPLVIDPLLASTFLGSGFNENARAAVLDASGDVYIAGETASDGFPVTTGVYDTTYNGGFDVFVSKLNADLTALLASTFIGGSTEGDFVNSMALDSAGNVIVAGYSYSSDFPVTSGAFDSVFGGTVDGFVFKMNSDLSVLVGSTYLGGTSDDYAVSVAVDSLDNIVVGGWTYSGSFPTTAGAFDTSKGGVSAGFITKLNSSLTGIISSTFLEGSSNNRIYAVAVDATDNIYAAGDTSSTNFPTTPGAYDQTYNASYNDCFISKLNSGLTSLLASTYLSGSDDNYLRAIAIDAAGDILVTGRTTSADFPVTATAYKKTNSGWMDAYVSRLDSSLSSLLGSTYIGGSGNEYARAIALGSSGNIHIAGYTESADYPTTARAFDRINQDGVYDGFISKMNSSLSSLVASTYIGGTHDDELSAIALDTDGNIYVTGHSMSSDFPVTGGAYDSSWAGGINDVIISKFSADLSATVTINSGAEFAKSSSVTLLLTCPFSGNSCSEMQISNDGVFDNEPSEPFAASKSWLLTAGDGVKSVCVIFKQNTGIWSDIYCDTIILDTTPPDTTITASPADPSNDISPVFSFSSADSNVTFQCRLDTGAYGLCVSPKTYYGLTAAAHTFSVRAVDTAGNIDPSPAVFAWTIDTTAPDTAIISSPSNPSNDSSPDFSFSSADSTAVFQCRLDSGAYSVCVSPKTYSGLNSGSHTFSVRAVDTAGNIDPTPSEYAWELDITAPVTSAAPAGGIYNSDQSVTLACTDGTGSGCAGTYYTVDGSAPTITSTLYSGPVSIAKNTVLKYISKDAVGNLEAVKTGTYTIDKMAPAVAVTVPADSSTVKNVLKISGTAGDPIPSAGLAKVEVQVAQDFEGTIYYLQPNMLWDTSAVWLTATGTASWSLNTTTSWTTDQWYTIKARVTDSAGNVTTDVSRFYCFIGQPVATDLTMNLSSQAILNNGTIDITGKLTRLPDVGVDLSGLTIKFEVTDPDGVIRNPAPTVVTYDQYGHYTKTGLSGFSKKGTYTIKAGFPGNTYLAAQDSATESILVGSSAGYAVIVEGKINNNEGLDSHNKTVKRIYETLKERGFTDANIYYFNYDQYQSGWDAVPSKSAIQTAVTTWAKSKLNAAAAPFYLIMVDHGNPNTFYINNETITPSDLNSWFATLEAGLTAAAKQERRTIVIGACYSGSFVPVLSKDGRIIITSAAANEESYKGPQEPDNIRSGEFFIEELFRDLSRGYSFKASFVSSTEKTEAYTVKGGNTNTPNSYNDGSVQHPLLDDDADGIGSNALSDGFGDGIKAGTLYLGVGVTNAASNPAEFDKVTETLYLAASAGSGVLWGIAADNNEVNNAWVEIRSLATALNPSGGTGQLELNIPKVPMSYNAATTRWEATYSQFTAAGEYEIFYFTKRKLTGEISAMKRSVVYKNRSGNTAPAPFNLVAPASNTEQKTVLQLDWTDSKDSDDLTYTVWISTNSTFTTKDYVKEQIPNSSTVIGLEANLQDLTTYYWKVFAVDSYGARKQSTQTWQFTTNNTNGLPAFLSGYVTDASTGKGLGAAVITSNTGGSTQTFSDGYYILAVPPGSMTLSFTKTGYSNVSGGTVSLTAGASVIKNAALTFLGTNVPALGAVTPTPITTEQGRAQTFTAIYTDADGYANIKTVEILVNNTVAVANGIRARYDQASKRLQLYNDAGTAIIPTTCTPGAAGNLTNTQGTVNCSQTTVAKSGSTITMKWSITPKAAFIAATTAKKIYTKATDNAARSAGFSQKAAWTIISANTAPILGTITHTPLSSAAGVAHALTAIYTDANGYANLKSAELLVTAAATGGANSIWAKYDQAANKLYLYNDAGTAVLTATCTPGEAGKTISNTQGTLNCAATTVTKTGNNLTVKWNITPKTVYTGAKNLKLRATDNSNTAAGLVDKGDWTITAAAPPALHADSEAYTVIRYGVKSGIHYTEKEDDRLAGGMEDLLVGVEGEDPLNSELAIAVKKADASKPLSGPYHVVRQQQTAEEYEYRFNDSADVVEIWQGNQMLASETFTRGADGGIIMKNCQGQVSADGNVFVLLDEIGISIGVKQGLPVYEGGIYFGARVSEQKGQIMISPVQQQHSDGEALMLKADADGCCDSRSGFSILLKSR